MTTSSLIENCYKNNFGIDLKRYHKSICKVDKHQKNIINNINSSDRIIFEDGISSHFKLTTFNNLLYLMGDKSCYLCSKVVESNMGADFNFVRCIAISGKNKVKGETDIRKSAIIVSMFSDLIPLIQTEIHFYNFLRQVEYTYSDCEWYKRIYSLRLYVKLVNFWNYKQKIKKLFDLGLFYPMEFVIYVIYNNIEIKNENILRYFVASLSESTNKIFSFEDINKEFTILSSTEIEDLLAMNYVAENINLDKIDDDYFADLLGIDWATRYNYDYNTMNKRAKSIFKVEDFDRKYTKLLSTNFRALENKMRKNKGYDEVGTFFMEKLLYNKLCETFPNLNIISQFSPDWLSPQRIDIFIDECNLAIEYNGAQHYLPIDYFGGEEGLRLRQVLDQRKRRKCDENRINFVEISYEEDFDFAFNELRLYIEDIFTNRQ